MSAPTTPTAPTPPLAPAAAALPSSQGPRSDGNNLARGLALAAALAAGLYAPALLVDADHRNWVLQAVAGLALGAVLLALSGWMPQARTLREWLVFGYGATLVASLAMPLLLLGAVSLAANDGLALGAALVMAWAFSLALNRWETWHAFATARAWDSLRSAACVVAMALWLPLAAWRLAGDVHGLLQPRWQGTVMEGMATGASVAVGLAALLVSALLALWLPRQLARAQLRGQIAISAASESLWFTAWVSLLLPLALTVLPERAAVSPWWSWPALVPQDGLQWGDVALRVLAVALAHGATRLVLGRVGAVVPVPLLVVVPFFQDRGARRFLARLPSAWGAGPVSCIGHATLDMAQRGSHAAIADRAGVVDTLFPHKAADLQRYAEMLPPAALWRALPVREAWVPNAELLAQLARQLITPQTWVVWMVHEPVDALQHRALGQALPELPSERLVVADLSPGKSAGPQDAGWAGARSTVQGLAERMFGLASLINTPRYVGTDARAFADWLRARARPPAPRRLVLLHDAAQTALADRLVQALSGRHDPEGRFVEAAALGGDSPWRLLGTPLWAIGGLARALQRGLEALPPDAPSLALRRAMLKFGLRLLPEDTPEAQARCELVLLCGPPAPVPRAQERTLELLLGGADSSVALLLDAGGAIPAGVKSRIDAMALGTGGDSARLHGVVEQLLRRAAVTMPDTPPLAAAPAAPAPVFEATAAAPRAQRAGLLVAMQGVAVSRLEAWHLLMRARLGEDLGLDLMDAHAALQGPRIESDQTLALLILTAAQQAVDGKALEALVLRARVAGKRVWWATMGIAGADMLMPGVLRLPLDWREDDPVPGPCLAAWTDALVADLGSQLQGPEDATATPGARSLALSGDDRRLLVGRTNGGVRRGAQLLAAHAAPVDAVLELSDGRWVSAAGAEVKVWRNESLLSTFAPGLAARWLREVQGVDLGRWLLMGDGSSRLWARALDGEASRELTLPWPVVDAVALAVVDQPGWCALAARDNDLRAVRLWSGEVRALLAGPTLLHVGCVAEHAGQLFFGGQDALGRGLVGVHASVIAATRARRLKELAAPVTALCPLGPDELLFGDAAGGVHRWRSGGSTRAEPVAQARGSVQAITCDRRGVITVLADGWLTGAGWLGPETK